ncbi:MAG: HPr family phosphocarrier protein [Candidatus Zixiibacteriota bacterium]|nr:MAG: HPr family phosphocarrier protein [candidate division Zixibacteria bacterium]
MVEVEVMITNKLGLHARPAAKLVQTASEFESNIVLIKENLEVNAKSIMGVMMLAAEMGTTIIIKAEGPDEKKAVRAVAHVFNSRFGEE